MLCARVLRAHDATKKPNVVLRIFEAMFDSWLRAYEWALDWVLARKALMLLVTLATLGGTVYLYMIVPKGFFPQEDTGFLIGVTEAATDTSFEAMKERQQALVDRAEIGSGVDYINSTVGSGGPNPTANYGRLFIALKPKKERDNIRRGGHRPAARPRPARFRACRRSSSRSRTSISAAGYRRASISTRCRAATPSRCIAWRPRCATRSRSCRACSTSPPTSTSRTRR
jgi:multidrug efflux pump subunit AcrB